MSDWFRHSDCLSLGDLKSRDFDSEGVEVHSIDRADHPLFLKAFEALWLEFGEKAEVEEKRVLEQRLSWQGKSQSSGFHFFYQMLWIEKNGRPMGVRDHTVINHPDFSQVVVHLSHNLVFPDFRRSGLAGWMRGWPLALAKQCVSDWGVSKPISLVAEMEPLLKEYPDRLPRLAAVEKAGFLKVGDYHYFQPDFRPHSLIDRCGGAELLPMSLIIRRVERENEIKINGGELQEMVKGLYSMYGEGFRDKDMKEAWVQFHEIEEGKCYPLLKPTSF